MPLEVQPGAMLAGRYLVRDVLGSGGMGVVVAAEHVLLGEAVALKFLLPEFQRDQDAKNRFAREAWTTAKIKSEYVVRVIDVGELPSGAPFMVMEYLDGTDLARVLDERGRLPIAQAVHYLLQACEGIAEAHALGIVHRDLKPSNFFCVRRSDGITAIKLLDFGMSKLLQRTGVGLSQSITSPSLIVGSPLYMSPEQMSSAKSVDARADIWSLGVILYQLLAGECPFVATTFPELAVQIAVQQPKPLREHRPEVPRGLDQAVLRCLEKDRTKRFEDVAQLAAALVEFAPAAARAHAERAARVLRKDGVATSVGMRASVPHSDPPPPVVGAVPPAPARSWRLAAAALGVIGLTALGGARFLPLEREGEPSQLQAAAPAVPPVIALPEPELPPQPWAAKVTLSAARAPEAPPAIAEENPAVEKKKAKRPRAAARPKAPVATPRSELDELGGRF